MGDLISRSKLINDIATYFFSDKCNLDRLGRDLREIIDDQPTAYSVDKVVEELEGKIADMNFCEYRDEIVKQGFVGTETGIEAETIRDKAVKWNNNSSKRVPYEFIDYVEGKREIGVSDDVCEWRLCDEEANVYDTSCRNPHILIEGTPKENNYKYCPYCGKKIKVVE